MFALSRTAREHLLKWYFRSNVFISAIAGLILPFWEEPWNFWGVVAVVSFLILICYGYSKLLPLETLVTSKIIGLMDERSRRQR